MMLKIKRDTIYSFIFLILFFISYNVTIYGYFVSKYIIAIFALLSLIILFFLNIKKNKISKKNILFSICIYIVFLLYIVRNEQISDNLFSDCWTLVILIALFLLQFNDDWIKIPYKIVNIFTLEHLVGTFFCFLFSPIYKEYILPIFLNGAGSSDLINQVNQNMIAGFTTNYGSNATYLAIGFLVLWSVYIQKSKKSIKDIAFISIIYLAMLITGKRGTLIFSTLTAIIIYFVINKDKISKRLFKGFILCGVTIIVFLLLANIIPNVAMIYNRIFNSNDILNGRGDLYSLAWKLFLEHPIFGIGWGNFKYNIVEQLNVHNIYLQLLCEVGLVGATIIIGFMIITLLKTYKLLKNPNYISFKKELAISLTIQIMVMLVGISSTPLYGVEALYPYLIACAIPHTITINERRKDNEN